MSGHVLAYCQQVSDNLRKCFSYVVKFLVEAACYASFKYFDWKLEPCSSKANHPSSFRVSKALHKPLTHTGFVLLENKCLSPDAGSLQSVLSSFCFSTPCFQTPSCALQWLPCPWGTGINSFNFAPHFLQNSLVTARVRGSRCATAHKCWDNLRTVCKHWIFPHTTWVPEMEFRLSSLGARSFTC